MSACASGTLLEQHVFGVQAVTPSAVYPVAVAMTGFLPTTFCALTVYVLSGAASLCTRASCKVASVTTAAAGSSERSNFIKIAFATLLSGQVYVLS